MNCDIIKLIYFDYLTLIADFDLYDEIIKEINNFLIMLVSWATK